MAQENNKTLKPNRQCRALHIITTLCSCTPVYFGPINYLWYKCQCKADM